jgi:hypothetical protein
VSPRYSPAALAALPHTDDGRQLLIVPTIPPPERKDRLNSMAWQGARTPVVQGAVYVIGRRLAYRVNTGGSYRLIRRRVLRSDPSKSAR